MLILSAAQVSLLGAARTDGVIPTGVNAGLRPLPLVDGSFFLPERVLTDPEHVKRRAALLTLPAREVLTKELPGADAADATPLPEITIGGGVDPKYPDQASAGSVRGSTTK